MTFHSHAAIVLRLAMWLVASLAVCRADPDSVEDGSVLPSSTNQPASQHSEWRNALHVEFSYVGTQSVEPAVPLPAPAAPGLDLSVASDTVVLPRFVVHEDTSSFLDLDKSIRAGVASATAAAKQEAVGKKLGIGLHEFKFKHVSFGCYTIFYIPIAAGMSW